MKKCSNNYSSLFVLIWVLSFPTSTAGFTIRRRQFVFGDRSRLKTKSSSVSSVIPRNSDLYTNRGIAGTKLRSAGGAFSNDISDANPQKQRMMGRTLAVFVSFLYGTLYVCLRRVYALSNPPSAPALSATRGWLAALCFLHLPFQRKARTSSASEAKAPSKKLLWLTAFDLAIWNFLAQGLINLSLLFCSSGRVSFLSQSSVIFTPLLSLLLGEKVATLLWIGVGIAFAGLCILSSGGSAVVTTAAKTSWFTSISPGDGLVLGGALCWSIYLVRLTRASSAENNRHRVEYPAMDLQAIKTFLLAIMYTVWWVANSFINAGTPSPISAPWWTSWIAWFWLAVSAVGPGALADVLQQKGQKHISASEANIIMSLEPVFATMTGLWVLGETLALREIVGGALILLAAIVSSFVS